MENPLIYFDGKKCIGCHTCEIACQLENDAPPGVRLRWVRSHEKGSLPDTRLLSVSTACFHCADPACVSSCPAGALKKRKDGVVEHVRSQCIGCGYCVQSCPFHVPKLSPSQHTMRKCSFCLQRIGQGKKPACVSKCPTNALTFFSDRKDFTGTGAYGKEEGLHMVYLLPEKAQEFSLPEPVPLNTATAFQPLKWIAGIVPGVLLFAWLWQRLAPGEEDHG
jgi:Fe-S-cluster-containing dehydrogenase component